MSLDFKLKDLQRYMYDTVDAIIEFYRGVDDRPVVQAPDAIKLQNNLAEPIPDNPLPIEDFLQLVREKVFENATISFGPNCFAYVISGGNHAGIIAEMLTAALAQNGGKWHLSPIAVEMERLVTKWLSQFIGYRNDVAGVFTSGGSMANQVGITVARNVKAPWDVKTDGLSGSRQLVLYASDETHSCILKAANVLGLGVNGVHFIPSLSDDTIDLKALDSAIEEDRKAGMIPFCVVANAGTVNTGAIDPIDAVAEICKKHDLWLHVDGAYGVFAAALPDYRHRFAGLDKADSVAVVPHKWLYVPVEDGVVLLRDATELRNTYIHIPAYLSKGCSPERFELSEHSFELTRSFKALKVWATFKAYGALALREAIQQNIEDVVRCAEYVDSHPDFELFSPSNLSIFCFRYIGSSERIRGDEKALDSMNSIILDVIEKEGRMFLTGTKINSRTALRICNVNHRTKFENLRRAIDIVEEIGKRYEKVNHLGQESR